MMHVSLAAIVEVCADVFGISTNDLVSARRTTTNVHARGAVVLLAYEMTRHGSAVIGRHLGDRDHTTVLYAKDRAGAWINSDADFAEKIARARELIPRLIEANLLKPKFELDASQIALRALSAPCATTGISIEETLCLAREVLDARAMIEQAEAVLDQVERLEQIEQCAAAFIAADDHASAVKFTINETTARAKLRDARTALKNIFILERQASDGQSSNTNQDQSGQFAGAAEPQ